MNTTIVEIPHVFWARFQEVFIGQENALLNASLSSAGVELAITRGSTKMKMRLRGEKVFTILVLNYYINDEDLLRCSRANSEDLKSFVVSSHWCTDNLLSNCVWRQLVSFSNLQEINEFREKVEQSENKWELFRNKWLMFERIRGTAEEKNNFLMAAIALMKTFGEFIVALSINESFDDERIQNFCTDLTMIMPRLRCFYWIHNFLTSNYLCMLSKCDKRTVEPTLKILDSHSALRYVKWYNVLMHSCKRWQIGQNGDELVQPEHVQVEQLLIHFPSTSLPYQKLLNADLSDFKSVTNLTLHGHNNIMVSIRMLRKLPNVSVLSLFVGWELQFSEVYNFIRDSGVSFPSVVKLTLIMNNPPFQLDILASLFPSLRQLRLKKSRSITSPATPLVDWKDVKGDFKNDEVDVYHLYDQKQPLSHSNIWSYLKNLSLLCIQTLKIIEVGSGGAADVAPANGRLQRQEIYTRLDNGEIQTEDLIIPFSHYWLE